MRTKTFVVFLKENDRQRTYERLDEEINKDIKGRLTVIEIHNLKILQTEKGTTLSRCVDFEN